MSKEPEDESQWTFRDRFATVALMGLISKPPTHGEPRLNTKQMAERAYEYADEMLAYRKLEEQ